MKKLLILMVLSGVLASCTRVPCPKVINGKPTHSKHLRSVRHKLRVKYHYHQTKVGRIFKFNLF